MTKRLLRINIRAELIGMLWSGSKGRKTVSVSLTPNGSPFTREWRGFDDLFSFLVLDGDFDYCEIDFIVGEAEYCNERGHIIIIPMQFNSRGKMLSSYMYGDE